MKYINSSYLDIRAIEDYNILYMKTPIEEQNKLPCNASLMREDKSQKPDFTYVGELYDEFARVMRQLQYGETKYARLNFLNGGDDDALLTYKKSASRHINQFLNGQTDEDHAAAAVVNIIICMNIQKRLGEKNEI